MSDLYGAPEPIRASWLEMLLGGLFLAFLVVSQIVGGWTILGWLWRAVRRIVGW